MRWAVGGAAGAGAGGGSEVEVRTAACVRVTDLTPLLLPLQSHFTRLSQSWGPRHLPIHSSESSQLNYPSTLKKRYLDGELWSKGIRM